MPGKTGKRSKPSKPCNACGNKITGSVMRRSEGDYHESCWWKKFFPNSVHAKS